MSLNFHKNSAGILASVLIGIIILSFMFSGFQRGMGPKTVDTIAEVDGTPIKIREFQTTYERQLAFYKQMFNATGLTTEQIEKMQLKKRALDTLIRQKIMINFAEKIKVTPSEKEIAKNIGQLEYFLNEGKFDVNRYKAILAQNGMTPQEFEDSIAESIKTQTVLTMTQNMPLSHTYIKELNEIKKDVLKIRALQVYKSSLSNFIEVSDEKIAQFLSNPENGKKLENYFSQRKSSLDRPSEATARHILMTVTEEKKEEEVKGEMEKIYQKVTAANFSELAKTYTEDPAGKENGGELPTIRKGMTVPEFEDAIFSMKNGEISKPFKTPYGYHIVYLIKKSEEEIATLEKYRMQIAKEIIQREDTVALSELENRIIKEATALLKENNSDKISAFEKKYSAHYTKESHLSKLDDTVGTITISSNDQMKLFNESTEIEKDFPLNTPSEIAVLIAQKGSSPKSEEELNSPEKLVAERNNQQKILSEQNQEAIFKHLQETSKIKMFGTI